MVKEVAPNLSYHYWGLGIRGQRLTEEADPLVLVRGSEFNHEKEIETEDDEGHMGTATTRMSSYRTKASANPSFTDKCRYKEGWEDMWLLLLGSDDGEGNIRKTPNAGSTATTQIFDYLFKVNVAQPQDPYFATLVNGFAKTSTDAYKYEDALMSEFEVTGTNEEAPTYTSTFATNYPKFNQPNPARVFPSKTVFPKSADVRIFIAPQGDYQIDDPEGDDYIGRYEYPCYLEWTINVNNNIESVPCSGDDFGESTKVLGNREGEVNITVPWTNATKHLEYEFQGGSADSTTVTTDNDVRTVWVVMENTLIGDSDVKYRTIIKVPQVVMTSVTSEQSGSDAKQIELEGQIEESGSESFIETIVTTDLSDLHIDTTTGSEGSLYDNTTDISVTVTDGTNPVEGATVTVNEAEAQTDASGIATFASVVNGSTSIKVEKEGIVTKYETVNVSSSSNSFTVTVETI